MRVTLKALEGAGHEILDWEPTEHGAALQNFVASLPDTGLSTVQWQLNPTNEHIPESMKPFLGAAPANEVDRGIAPSKIKLLAQGRAKLQRSYLERWQATATADGKPPIDGIIMPTSAWAAAKVATMDKVEYFNFAGAFNVLDLPACTFPVRFADKSVGLPRKNFKPLNELDGRVQETYDPEIHDGAPVCLQLICKRLEEEKVLEIFEVVKEVLEKKPT